MDTTGLSIAGSMGLGDLGTFGNQEWRLSKPIIGFNIPLESAIQVAPDQYYKSSDLELIAGGEFLTIHEYVSAVHLWLIGMREMPLDALGKLADGPLVILYFSRGPLRIDTGDKGAHWRQKHKPEVWLSEAEKETGSTQSKSWRGRWRGLRHQLASWKGSAKGAIEMGWLI
ncbi:hypothetical protein CORC01_14088 [Colletotrichum orchidophilum]|uniref:Uncharacterized protein n=1 Tax=Colletotrichum orchidophilum TaxID=1209926 RepID=A0A1G4ANK0_9PEZI|nr:uncharacterized protein CORC01_14088 [Colletotrichum orchidophilum]OHE90623.1 hypothetical protein CORC01_14088 [Colletotrichum orchidophilum]